MKYKPWQVFQDFDGGAVQLKQIYKVPLFLLFVSSDRSFYSNNVLLVPPKWLKLPRFGWYQKWHFGCQNQNSETTFQYKLAPKTPKKPPQEPKSALEK